MHIINNPTQAQWKTVIDQTDHPHINQSWEWGEVYQAIPHVSPIRLLALHDDNLVGALQGFDWHMGPLTLATVSGGTGGGGGPVIANNLSETLQQNIYTHLIHAFFEHAKRMHSLKTTLYTTMGDTHPIQTSGVHVTPQWNPVAKLPSDPDQMLHQQIDQKTRNQIFKAEKNGVEVREGRRSDLRIYRSMQEHLVRSKSLPVWHLNSIEHLHLLWDTLVLKGMMKLWIAKLGDEILGGAITLYHRKGLLYQSGVATEHGRQLYASNLIQWHAIRDAIEHNYTFYNLGGGTKDASDPRYGITQFKIGFGGEFVPFQRYSIHGNRFMRFAVYKGMRLFGRNEWFPLLVYP